MNLRKKAFFWLLTFVLITGCSAAPETPDPTRLPKPQTSRLLPTLTAIKTLTQLPPTPASTPELPLKTSGPYLVYLRTVDDDEEKQQLVLMDADGKGRKVIPAPSENRLEITFVSPDGRWLAYYLGSAKNGKQSALSLNLLDLQTGQTRLVSNLLSKDYPDNFTQAAKDLNISYINAETLQYTFIDGITRSIGWSPDGGYLAFAGQMDGLSSDVYLYDLTKDTIRRLTHGPDEVLEISWSPDGKWILPSGETRLGEGGGYNEDAIALNGSTIVALPYRNYGGTRAWYNGHTYVSNSNQNVLGDYDLRSVDIETGRVIHLWNGAFNNFVFDPEKALVVISPLTINWPPKPDEDLPGGSYLIHVQDGSKIKLDHQAYQHTSFFGLGGRRFFTRYDDAYFIAADGTIIPADPALDNVSASPDKQHWVSLGSSLKLFNADDTLIFDKPLPFVLPDSSNSFGPGVRTLWNPDSSGLFFTIENQIYSFDIVSGEINLVENQLALYQRLIFTSVVQK